MELHRLQQSAYNDRSRRTQAHDLLDHRVQIGVVIAGAFGAGLAGVVVNTAHASMVIAARALYVVFAVVGLLGAWVAYRAIRDLR